jgi:hypothetical protein
MLPKQGDCPCYLKHTVDSGLLNKGTFRIWRKAENRTPSSLEQISLLGLFFTEDLHHKSVERSKFCNFR